MPEPAAVQESTEILPCPFCGSSETRWVADLWFIACHNNKCAATGPTHKTREAALAAWNTRKPAASPVARVSAEVIRQLDSIADDSAAIHDSTVGRDSGISTMAGRCCNAARSISASLAQPSAEGDGWIAVTERLPVEAEEWCIVKIAGVTQKMPAQYENQWWYWADKHADPAPAEVVSDWYPCVRPVAKEGRES